MIRRGARFEIDVPRSPAEVSETIRAELERCRRDEARIASKGLFGGYVVKGSVDPDGRWEIFATRARRRSAWSRVLTGEMTATDGGGTRIRARFRSQPVVKVFGVFFLLMYSVSLGGTALGSGRSHLTSSGLVILLFESVLLVLVLVQRTLTTRPDERWLSNRLSYLLQSRNRADAAGVSRARPPRPGRRGGPAGPGRRLPPGGRAR